MVKRCSDARRNNVLLSVAIASPVSLFSGLKLAFRGWNCSMLSTICTAVASVSFGCGDAVRAAVYVSGDCRRAWVLGECRGRLERVWRVGNDCNCVQSITKTGAEVRATVARSHWTVAAIRNSTFSSDTPLSLHANIVIEGREFKPVWL